ncbi:ABC transporter ATP-binding protein [Wenyingzhuangia sp. chi5]|uniref:ABC transporter ATP-binding protein n=1 Tax=Wenyingzhuangia gilva TaxID=3057677 RepID=A0ABT8VT14_9FLAO|nr:ABC transporter ATP-binding protein [Wenyingzhuangia sp. chi5]MDO3695119.1 ABC transporter ATP-binding protein [Wenyingzhuangia sp. chi5]
MEESNVILKVENISKQYRLGTLGTGTISHDLNRWWHQIRGKEDPYLKIGETNDRSTKGTSEYVWALKDISFEVKKGEIIGIIGKNGAGKSTLLKILSRVTGPTTGSIKTKGRIASLLEVGTGFHPEMTGRENVYLNGAILGMTQKEINAKIDEIIAFSGCERYIDTPTKRYSSGMTVRLAFAVAAFLEPDILVVDEVLAVGDAEFQKKAIGKMQDISNSEGRTVLFVSHDMTAIRSLCPTTIMLKNGSVYKIGSTDEVIDEYLKISVSEHDENLKKSKFIKEISLETNTINILDKLSVELKFRDRFEEKINYCFIGVENMDQKRIFSIGTHLDKEFSGDFKPNDKLICTIDNVNLIQGSYKAMVAIGTNIPRANLEVIHDAFSFKVINNDVFENGMSLNRQQGEIIYKSKWLINE